LLHSSASIVVPRRNTMGPAIPSTALAFRHGC
jgi:hypothetical protein